jgi:hypothetical protein
MQTNATCGEKYHGADPRKEAQGESELGRYAVAAGLATNCLRLTSTE